MTQRAQSGSSRQRVAAKASLGEMKEGKRRRGRGHSDRVRLYLSVVLQMRVASQTKIEWYTIGELTGKMQPRRDDSMRRRRARRRRVGTERRRGILGVVYAS